MADQGNANVAMDNLMAQGKAKPMIVVTPLGYGVAGGGQGPPDMVALFARTLLEEVIPRVKNTTRQKIAIAVPSPDCPWAARRPRTRG